MRLTWRGKSDGSQASSFLDAYLTETLDRARVLGAAVDLDCAALDYVSSSTISSLITFVRRSAERRIALTIVYDADSRWQQLSFEALRVFDKNDGLLSVRAVAQDRPAE